MHKHLLPVFILFGLFANAQNWQWARAGGGIDDVPLTAGPWESWMNDMTVDKWGNVYAVGSVWDFLQFTGTSDTFPYYGAVDAVIVKYDKCGNFQWAIVNGTSESDLNTQVTVDTSGNIYVGGGFDSQVNSPVHIHKTANTDTLIYNSFGCFYMKYDPNGNLIWVTNTGNVWAPINQCLKQMSDGRLVSAIQGPAGTWNNFTMPKTSNQAMLVFDPDSGKFLGGTLIDTLPYSNLDNGIVFSPFVLDENDNIYLPINTYNLVSSGQPYPGAVFFGQSITIPTNSVMLVKLDKDLNMTKYVFDDNSGSILNVSYSEGFLYSCGHEYSFSNYFSDTVADLTSITAGGSYSVYRVYKLDTGTLAPLWESSPQFQDESPNETYIATTSKHVWMSGSTYGLTVWDGDSINVLGATQDQFLFKFDKETGHCDTIYVDSGETSQSNVTSMIMADPQENLIIGGQFAEQFTCGPNTLVPWGGSESPIFFIEKWGIDCSDSINTNDNPYPPANLLTTTGGMHSVSLQWNDNSPYRISFHVYRSPDGVSNWQLVDTVLSAQTALSDTGLTPNTWYWYKVAAWNMAGESDYTNIDSAKTDTVTGIENVALNNWVLYPNPAKDQLTLIASANNAQVVTIELNDVTGNEVMNQTYSLAAGSNMHYIDISQLPAGYYEVSIISNGLKTTKPVVKF